MGKDETKMRGRKIRRSNTKVMFLTHWV